MGAKKDAISTLPVEKTFVDGSDDRIFLVERLGAGRIGGGCAVLGGRGRRGVKPDSNGSAAAAASIAKAPAHRTRAGKRIVARRGGEARWDSASGATSKMP